MSSPRFPVLHAEWLKIRASGMIRNTVIAFGLAPVMGGLFIRLARDPDAMARTGLLAQKAEAMHFEADWMSYASILTQAVAVGGIMVFGFVTSWIFGREYSDGTVKDLLSLPATRTRILNAKFMLTGAWCLGLALTNLLAGGIIGSALGLPDPDAATLWSLVQVYLVTTLLTLVASVPVAFFALWGRGYLAPLGFVALTLVFAQVIAAIGWGTYFPWSVPALYSGAGGDHGMALNATSYLVLAGTGLVGYISALRYWNRADHAG